MTAPVHYLKAPCPCGDPKCKAFGNLTSRPPGHSRRCGGDCCAKGQLQRQNRRRGMSAQETARKKLGVPAARLRSRLGNEENWRHPLFRFEVKSGAQVEPIATRYTAAAKQADASKAVGDPRPVALVAMPDGQPGLVVLPLDVWESLVVPFIEEGLGP